MVDWLVPLADLNFDGSEKEAVNAVLDSGWLAMGAGVQAFEEEFARLVGVKHAVAVTNGTVSLHLAALALGLGPGDEVIVPSLTFVATAAAILYVGATPVFADINGEQDLTISLDSIEERITDRTKAIFVMHYGGYPCDMPAVMDLAAKYGLGVVEDAAHAPGASIDGRGMGGWGHIGSFSFFPNKNLTTAEGGMVTTNDDELAEKLRRLRSHGMTTLTWDRHRGHAYSYDVVDLGYNYRMDEVRAAIGRAQLRKLPEANQRRRELTALYRELLAELAPDVTVPFQHHQGVSAAHILPILLPPGSDRIAFMERMKAERIQTSIHYPPIHTFTHYRENDQVVKVGLDNTENVAAREVTLPLYAGMGEEKVELVVRTVQQALQVVRAG
ncbi:MAG TPA: DegT/DnrJ/EryC1/StrS family aminotransferase [Chloroflexi bacterium]|jgi:dTDP-4-amino-4,6-dideoxygalactose transaminase|nr:DegT/DnrJ/EryC1/StrS family aminotransferase [Chloroflexota bacterium]HPO57601.1 DegT/DnrJ/EryC1/StrS family aminotransferase [Anaerolineaceae bacterium]